MFRLEFIADFDFAPAADLEASDSGVSPQLKQTHVCFSLQRLTDRISHGESERYFSQFPLLSAAYSLTRRLTLLAWMTCTQILKIKFRTGFFHAEVLLVRPRRATWRIYDKSDFAGRMKFDSAVPCPSTSSRELTLQRIRRNHLTANFDKPIRSSEFRRKITAVEVSAQRRKKRRREETARCLFTRRVSNFHPV